MIYLDYAAATPVLPEVADAMDFCMRHTYGNPSAVYAPAYDARRILNESRRLLASSIGSQTNEIVFTSGGTESNNAAVLGVARACGRKRHLVIGSTERHSVLSAARHLKSAGYSVSLVPCDYNGIVGADAVERAIRPDTTLVSVQYANNETGVIQPVATIGAAAKAHKVPFHCDAVSAYGHIPLNVEQDCIDLLSTSAHKLYGPKGVGFLYIRNGTPILPLMFGGAQEYRLRPGTQNIPAVAGFCKAVSCSGAYANAADNPSLRDRLQTLIMQTLPDCRVNGANAPRLPGYLSVTFPGVPGERLLQELNDRGVCAAARAACATGERTPSHVLRAMGLADAEADCTLRLTTGKFSTLSEIEKAAAIISEIVQNIKSGL